MSDAQVAFILFVFGILCIIHGLSFHLDYTRRPIVYWSIFTSSVYAATPLGISFVILCFIGLYPTHEMKPVLVSVFYVLLVTGGIFGFTMPLFISPWWFRYLRKTYDGDFIGHVLMADAAKDYHGWMKRTKTMEGLVRWAEGIARGRHRVTKKRPLWERLSCRRLIRRVDAWGNELVERFTLK